MIVAPALVAVSSLWFVDRRGTRWLGLTLLGVGVVGIFVVVLMVTLASERDAARCASLGGTPASGACWIDGEVQ